MNKKIISILMICMFLLTSLFVGTALGEKTPQIQNASAADLKIELITRTHWSNPIGIEAVVGNTGTEPVFGPITVTLKIKRGFLGLLYKYEDKTYTIVESGKYIPAGGSVYGAEWDPDPSITPGGIFTFQYKLNYEDSNPVNNVASHKYLIIHYRMFWFGQSDL